jgi:hypothetical protein
MNQTKDGVRAFCTCKPGYTGDRCATPTTCTKDTCGTIRVCSNEGRCVCPAGTSGDDCTTTTTCRTFKLFLKFPRDKKPLDGDSVLIVVAALGGVDASTLTVVGPIEVPKAEGVFEYDIKFCASADVDADKSYDTFQKNLGGSGLPVTEDPSNSATTGAASSVLAAFGVTAAAVMFAL